MLSRRAKEQSIGGAPTMNPDDDEVAPLLRGDTQDFAVRLAGHHHRLDVAIGADGLGNRGSKTLTMVFLHGRDVLAHAR